MITLVIIDAQKQGRDKVISCLSDQDDIRVLAQGNDAYDALTLAGSFKPDIAIINNHLEYIDGEELPPLLKARSPSTAVVILTAKISDYHLRRAVLNNVSGIVSWESDMDRLPWILKCIAEGGCFISPLLATRVLHLFSAENRPVLVPTSQYQDEVYAATGDPASYLSKAELRLLTCLGEGSTSEEIAKNLNLTVGTVRNSISTVMRKTGLKNRFQVACYAVYYGLVPGSLPEPARIQAERSGVS